VLLVKVVSAQVAIGLLAFEHDLDNAGQFVSGSGNSYWRTVFSAYPAIEAAQSIIAASNALNS
jgi:hypothetical protein